MKTDQHRLAIRATKLSFAYPDGTPALDNVDLDVESGQFLALLASNGSGKTTLIKVLVGLLKPQQGNVEIFGQAIHGRRSKELCEQIGLVFQNPNDQLFAATVEEDVAFGVRNMGLDEDEVERRVSESLQAVGADALRSRAVHHLSFGQQKRVAIAGVLAMRPAILLLDEPTAGLDPAGETMMLRLLQRLNREHALTVVMATHSVDPLPLFADQIAVLHDGRKCKQGTPEEVFADQDMIEKTSLRLPYIAGLFDEIRRQDQLDFGALPLTIRDARTRLLERLSDSALHGERP